LIGNEKRFSRFTLPKRINSVLVRVGNWLTAEEGKKLLSTESRDNLRSCCNRALLALLIGCGLRSAEVTTLRFEDCQLREGHWVIAGTGIGKGEYARVKSVDVPKNRLTVELQDGRERTYDPRRQQGVSVFREEMRSFSVGDRVQFTAPAHELKVANRELGTIERISEDGRLRLKMDGGRTADLDPRKHPHLDHGYAMTSYSSQGQTADRILIHVDTELGAKDLLNCRMAYVSVSRGRYDAQIYTNNAATLGQELARDVSHSPAIQQEPAAHKIEPQTAHTNEIAQGFGLGL